MNTQVKTKDFLRAASFAASVVSGRTAIPCLSHLLLTAEGDRLNCFGSDLAMEKKMTCSAAGGGNWRAGVPARLLTAFLKQVQRESCDISIEGGRLTISGDRSASFSTIDAEEFPSELAMNEDAQGIDGDEMARRLSMIRHAISTEAGRPSLCGAFFEFDPKGLDIAATDGRRACVTRLDMKGEGGFIVPLPIITEVSQQLQGDAQLAVSENAIRFSGPSWSISGKLIDQRIPHWRLAIPEFVDFHEIRRERLISALETAKLFTTDLLSGVWIEFGANRAEISVTTEHSYTDTIETKGEKAMRVGVNPSYLLDAITCEDGESVKVGLIDEFSPIGIVSKYKTEVVLQLRPKNTRVNK